MYRTLASDDRLVWPYKNIGLSKLCVVFVVQTRVENAYLIVNGA